MQFIKITIATKTADQRELLIAQFSEMGFEGFEENDEELISYIPVHLYDKDGLDAFIKTADIGYTTEIVKEQNWNAQWEENFQPVVVEGFCTIRADFHPSNPNTPLEIIITPKMSFGTGHHATTQLMMLMMKDMDLAQKNILDFGTGTGILAILAEKLGASHIIAIDNDEWSYENAKENIKRNDCKNAAIRLCSIEEISTDNYDVIVANINRHILLGAMHIFHNKLTDKGQLLMSGLLKDDEEIIVTKALDEGFRLHLKQEKDNWIGLLFDKK